MYKVQAGKPAEVSAGYYSRASKPAKYLAPAEIQSEASALILFTKEGTEDSHRSKIRLFLSFRISRLISSVKERKPTSVFSRTSSSAVPPTSRVDGQQAPIQSLLEEHMTSDDTATQVRASRVTTAAIGRATSRVITGATRKQL
jgi:hypothetical protein